MTLHNDRTDFGSKPITTGCHRQAGRKTTKELDAIVWNSRFINLKVEKSFRHENEQPQWIVRILLHANTLCCKNVEFLLQLNKYQIAGIFSLSGSSIQRRNQ